MSCHRLSHSRQQQHQQPRRRLVRRSCLAGAPGTMNLSSPQQAASSPTGSAGQYSVRTACPACRLWYIGADYLRRHLTCSPAVFARTTATCARSAGGPARCKPCGHPRDTEGQRRGCCSSSRTGGGRQRGAASDWRWAPQAGHHQERLSTKKGRETQGEQGRRWLVRRPRKQLTGSFTTDVEEEILRLAS